MLSLQPPLSAPSLGAGLAGASPTSPDTPTMFRGTAAAQESQSAAAAPEAGGTQQTADGSRLDDLAVDSSLSWPLHVRQSGGEAAGQPSSDATDQAEGVRLTFHMRWGSCEKLASLSCSQPAVHLQRL